MSLKTSAKPMILGAFGGAAILAVIGFGWGGWMTMSKSTVVASDKAQERVVAVLVPICVEQSKRDPNSVEKLSEIEDAVSYKRTEMLMQTGWATMPGSEGPDRIIAGHCLEELEVAFQ